MAQTVVGMFDNSSEAQQAVQALVNAGFSRDMIDVSGAGGQSGASSTSHTGDNDDHENGITRFFKNLFGDDDDDANKYSSVASKSNSIVTVHATDNDESERAADILDDYGAVDVDEKATQYGYQAGSGSGYTGTAGASGMLGSDSSSGLSGGYGNRGNTVGAFDTGTEAGISGTASSASDFGGSGSSNYSGTDGGYRSGENASDLTGSDNAYRSGERDSDATDDTSFSNTSDRSYDEDKKIPIIEENIEIGKKQVNTGGVRVRSRIVERPVEESIRLREERVNVERNSVDRPATEADFSNFEETDIEMVERAEVPVVNKQARVIEEVSLNKEVDEWTETVSDTVRKTEVDIDKLDRKD